MNTTDDAPIIIADNTEVIKALTDMGVLHFLEVTPDDEDNVKFYHFTEENYWCQASHHTGHEDDKDNGYMLIKVPKSKMTSEQAAEFFLDMMITNRETPGLPTWSYKDKPPLKFN